MNDTPFLSRWSRLKNEQKTEKPVVIAPIELSEEELAEKVKTLPPLDLLKAGDDLKAFMQTWVPDALKNAALRKMWLSDASLTEQLCQPLDYAYDYNNPVGVIGFGALPEGFDSLKEANALFEKFKEEILEPVEEIEAEPHVAEIEKPEESVEISVETPVHVPVAKQHGSALPKFG